MEQIEIRVLLIEDDEDDYILTAERLAEARDIRAQLDWETSFSAGLEALKKREHDVYLLDYRLGEHTGLELLEEALKQGVTAPMILLTGQGDHDVDIDAMTKGAADYLQKDRIDTPLLERSIRYSLKQAQTLAEVRERTTQLEAANKDLQAFAYSVSHDLRSPLTTLNGFANLMADSYVDRLPAEILHFLQVIQETAQKIDVLIDSLLEFSQISERTLQWQSVDTAELAQQIIRDLNSQWQQRKVKFQVAELPNCHGDYDLLKQVFFNLIDNALKYSQKRQSARIDIGYYDINDEIIYYVQDNGVGFDMQHADKLFGIFQRLHKDGEFPGTGIGLAMVKSIVERHGGRVWAEAEVNKGAKFYFSL